MSNTLSLRYGYRARTDCSYWDYYVEDQRLAELLEVGDFIPPFGWLERAQERRFAGMLLRKCAGDASKLASIFDGFSLSGWARAVAPGRSNTQP